MPGMGVASASLALDGDAPAAGDPRRVCDDDI